MPPAFCLAYRELYQGVGFFEGHGRTDELKELAWETKNLVASNCQYYTTVWRLADRSDRYLTTCDGPNNTQKGNIVVVVQCITKTYYNKVAAQISIQPDGNILLFMSHLTQMRWCTSFRRT
jgi:hypothetical protein